MRFSILPAAALALAAPFATPSAGAQQTKPAPAAPPAPVPATAPAQAPAQAQQVQVTFLPAARLDLIAGKHSALHAGFSVATPLSNYFTLGGTLAAGVSGDGLSARTDLFGSFSLDPYRTMAWEPYVGGGATVRYDVGGVGTRTYLLGFVGVNGPAAGAVVPGLELGLGGGVRLGVTLRWAMPARR